MTVVRAFCIVLAGAIFGALIGLGIGYFLAITIPSYYRGVFQAWRDPTFDPVQVGVGLGLTQGLIAGLVVGCVVVLAVAWYNSRRQLINQEMGSKWAQPVRQLPGGSEAIRPSAPPGA